MVKSPYQAVHTSQYWKGMMMPNMPSSTQWSLRRLCVSVTNSRSAANEISANRMVMPVRPKKKATVIATTITHQALMRWLRLTSVEGSGFGARHDRMPATMLAVVSTPTRPTSRMRVSCIGGSVMRRLLCDHG